MLRRIGNALTFLVVAAAGFVAHRAFGASAETLTQAASGASDVVNTVAQSPKAFTAVAFGIVELGRRLWPTLKPSSPMCTLLAQVCALGIALLAAFKDFFIWLRDNGNVVKKPAAEASPGPVSPEDKP